MCKNTVRTFTIAYESTHSYVHSEGCPYSFLRVLLKKKAHSEQVFLLLTQNTAEIPTTSVIRYLTRNRDRSGRLASVG